MPTIQTANASESEVIEMTANEIISAYPETINSEQLRIILGISKRKCAWMLQNGVIPCKDTEKKTRRYTIEITDVIHYVNTVSKTNTHTLFLPYSRQRKAHLKYDTPTSFGKTSPNGLQNGGVIGKKH